MECLESSYDVASIMHWTFTAGQVEISAQNHNFAIDPATLPAGVEVSHINLNDGTCAGMTYPAMKVTYQTNLK